MTAPEGCGSKFCRLRKGALRYAFLTSICRSSKSFNAAMQRMARIDSQRATGANVEVKSCPKIRVRSFCDEATLTTRARSAAPVSKLAVPKSHVNLAKPAFSKPDHGAAERALIIRGKGRLGCFALWEFTRASPRWETARSTVTVSRSTVILQ